MSARDFFPQAKQKGREANYSPTVNADVKNGWRYASPLHVLIALKGTNSPFLPCIISLMGGVE